jgi:hypothetical protein
MLERSNPVSITIESKWRNQANHVDSECQTDGDRLPKYESKSCQVPERVDVHVQTDTTTDTSVSRTIKEQDGRLEVDVVALLFFLRRAEKVTMREIRHSAQTNCQVRLLTGKLRKGEQQRPLLQADLPSHEQLVTSNRSESNESDPAQNGKHWQVSSAVWMEQGHQLAITFQASEHVGLCTHVGRLGVWRLQRLQVNRLHLIELQSDQETRFNPDMIIEIESCPTVMAAHPSIASDLMIGTRSGRLIWIDATTQSIGDSSNVRFQTEPKHLASITFLQFQQMESFDALKSTLQLISTGLDGLIVLWQVQTNKLIAIAQLSLSLSALPRSMSLHRNYQTDSSAADQHCVGITCAHFSPIDSNLLVLGSEGGALLQCWIIQSNLQLGVTFVPHRSHVKQVTFAPKQPQFASFAADHEFRLYCQVESVPLLVLHIDLHPPTIFWLPSSSSASEASVTQLLCFERNKPAQLLQLDLNKKSLVMQKKIPFEAQSLFPSKAFFNHSTCQALLIAESAASQLYNLKPILI